MDIERASASKRDLRPGLQALWNMRLATLIICAPLLALCLLNLFYGLPDKLWLLAGGFFVFSLFLLGILVRGEAHRLQRAACRR